MLKIDMLNHRSLVNKLTALAVLAVVLTGCTNGQLDHISPEVSPSVMSTPLVHRTQEPMVQLSPTATAVEKLFDPDLDIHAEPVDVPLELRIPILKIQAPVIGVGLDSENKMDAPRGPLGGSIWQTAMWYRGSGIPGEPGTATFAGHVNDPLGLPGVFGHLRNLQPGDSIIVYFLNTSEEIHFVVNENIVYKKSEALSSAEKARIFGMDPEPDGLSRLTLITCTGYIVNGQYDGFRVIYATRIY
jgi:hypothetical protein